MKSTKSQKDNYIPYEGDPNKIQALIADVDGTLAHAIDRPIFGATNEQILGDKPSWQVIEVVKAVHEVGYTVIIMSGREDTYQSVTEKWLENHGVPYEHIFMRKTGDRRNDSIVKAELYKTHVEPKYQVLFAIDDRLRVLDTWRELGIFTLNVNLNLIDF